MAHQSSWNKYEAALLVDAYLKIEKEPHLKNKILLKLSERLRRMALNAGQEIDSTYRNLNGMQWQYNFMQKAFQNERLGTRTPPKLFLDIVKLYKTQPNTFREIIAKAHQMSNEGDGEGTINIRKVDNTNMADIKNDFQNWLKKQPKLKYPIGLILSIQEECSKYAVERKISKISFWDIRDQSQYTFVARKLLGMRLFRVMNRKIALTFDKSYVYYGDFLNDKATTEVNINSTSLDKVKEVERSEESVSLVIEFNLNEKYAYTTPISFSYFSDEKTIVDSWKDLYVKMVQTLIDDYPHVFEGLKEKNISSGQRIDFSENANVLRAPKLIKENYYAETNLSAHDIVKHIKQLLDMCNIDYENLIIVYKQKDDVCLEENVECCGESSRKAVVGSDCNEILNKFSNWLLVEKGLSQVTATGYASNLRSLSAYCSQTGIAPASFVVADPDELQIIANQIMQNTSFRAYNTEQHNRFSAALKKFLEYRVGVIAQTRVAQKTGKKKAQCSPYYQQVSSVLKEHYSYGFRLESTIDIKRFRRYAQEQNVEIPENDDELKAEIKNAGIQIEDKVYLIEADTFNYLRNTVENLTFDGSRILFYNCIYDFDMSAMEDHYITSADHLKAVLKQCKNSIFGDMKEIFFAKNFLSFLGECTERDAVTFEMQRIWGESQTRPAEEIAEQLSAIPDDYVRRYLSGSVDFVWVSEGVYFNMQRFIITEDEECEILSFVASECETKGYVSISEVPLGSTAEENYELSEFGLQEAIYNKVLISKYRLNGKILTKEDDANLDVVSLAKQYLLDKEECTFDEMDKKVTELAGTRYRYMAYKALYSSMVRADKNRYVAHQYVKFDVDAIDTVLSEMIKDRFIAIKEITSFALFPLCGLPWNHYLLESYCYLYSKKFCLKVVGFNDKNAGIIAQNSITAGYNDLLAQAAARAKIELSTEAVGQYYFETGYMGKRKFSDLESIVERAKALREDL